MRGRKLTFSGLAARWEFVFTAPGARNPTGGGLPRRRYRPWDLSSYSDILELKALERYFYSQTSIQNEAESQANLKPILEKAQTSQVRRRRRAAWGVKHKAACHFTFLASA